MEEPFVEIAKGDYSHFRRFDSEHAATPAYLKMHVKHGQTSRRPGDITRVLTENLEFRDSKHELGLQLADIVANTVRRAVGGNLRDDGWGDLGKLLLSWGGRAFTLTFMTPAGERLPDDMPYTNVLARLHRDARSLDDIFETLTPL